MSALLSEEIGNYKSVMINDIVGIIRTYLLYYYFI